MIVGILWSVIVVTAAGNAPSGYLFTLPSTMREGTEEKLCLAQAGNGTPMQVLLKFAKGGRNVYEVQTLFMENGCVNFSVPQHGKQRAILELIDSGETHQLGSAAIDVLPASPLTFINCDKPMYKPGQTVKFRMLTIDHNLRPRKQPMPLVTIKNPAGVRVRQWTNVSSLSGLVSLEMPLSEDPTLGVWKIEATVENRLIKHEFQVKEYVLPKFEIFIKPPKYLLQTTGRVDGEICARYTYGQPVKGTVVFVMWFQSSRSCRRRTGSRCTGTHYMGIAKLDGCYPFSVNVSTFRIPLVPNMELRLIANVTEHGTGVTLNEESKGPKVVSSPFTIKFENPSTSFFKPGLPFTAKLVARKHDGSPAVGEVIEVSMLRKWYSVVIPVRQTTDAHGTAMFTMPTRYWYTVRMFLYADVPLYRKNGVRREYSRRYYRKGDSNPKANIVVRKSSSPSNSFIQIEQHIPRQECDTIAEVIVHYTTSNEPILKFFYMVTSRNRVVFTGQKEVRHQESENMIGGIPVQSVSSLRIQVPISAKMAPKAQLLVYYIREDRETVADQVQFEVQKCFDNKVHISFDGESALPGTDATVRIRADPGSYCSFGVVDKSVDLLLNNDALTANKGFTSDQQLRSVTDEKARKLRKNEKPYKKIGEVKRRIRNPFASSGGVESLKAFKNTGLATITDMELETRQCRMIIPKIQLLARITPFQSMPDVPRARRRKKKMPSKSNIISKSKIPSKKEVRSYFPETWLWDIREVSESGELVITKEIPHTITEWVGNAVCSNTETGIGVSDTAKIRGFQPFFLSFTLPYSAVRNEVVPVMLTVSNYLTKCLLMNVSMSPSSDFELNSGERQTQICVCGGEKTVLKYYIVPTQIGAIQIETSAESVLDVNGTCGNSIVSDEGVGIADAVRRTLLVEAEGVQKEYTFSSYQCVTEANQTLEIDLPLPPTDLVPDSARGKVNVIGDVMGPALSNLQNLLQMPYGCGEQNMASWAPNIVAIQYLTSTNQLTAQIEQEAKKYMRSGYQRQLKYRHPDYSYSIWGGSGTGSMWLTAFVVKCLRQSSRYIEVDQDDVIKSIKWFLNQQHNNGCFPKVGYTHSYHLKGGIGKNSYQAAMTAFVLISILESGQMSMWSESVIKAVKCLDNQSVDDTYTLALMAYAYTLYDVDYPARLKVMEILEGRALYKDDGQKYWSRENNESELKELPRYFYRAPSAEVEITAYVLLSLIAKAEQIDVVGVKPIVKWLTKQRNANGGFSSTQDTVVALQALSTYAVMVYQHELDIQVVVRGNHNTSMNFTVDSRNSLLLQTTHVPKLPTTLYADFMGVGCVVIQANVKYNVFEVPVGPAFEATVNVYRAKDMQDLCTRRTIQICATYTGPGGVSRMTIVDVKMVTGWIPVKSTLKNLVDDPNVDVMKTEADQNKVYVYFDKFDSRGQCFYFDVEQEIEIEDPEKATIRIYDYYETDLEAVLQYTIRNTCGTNVLLPYPPPDVFICGVRPLMPFGNFTQIIS